MTSPSHGGDPRSESGRAHTDRSGCQAKQTIVNRNRPPPVTCQYYVDTAWLRAISQTLIFPLKHKALAEKSDFDPTFVKGGHTSGRAHTETE